MEIVHIWIDEIFRRCIDFKGRTSRKHLCFVCLCSLCIDLILRLIGKWLEIGSFTIFNPVIPQIVLNTGLVNYFSTIFRLALAIPIIAMWIRRMHDIGKSGYWVLLATPSVLWTILEIWASVADFNLYEWNISITPLLNQFHYILMQSVLIFGIILYVSGIIGNIWLTILGFKKGIYIVDI